MGVLASALKTASEMIERAMQEYDYSLALNPVLMLTIEREKQILGAGGAEYTSEIVSKYLRFNRFKLSIHITGKLSGTGYYQTAELKGDNFFSAMPDPNDTLTCRLKWLLLGPDAVAKNMKFDLVDAKMLGNGGELVYAGTKKWKSNMPRLRLNFCGNGSDTAEIYSFQPDMGKETWIIPKYGPTDVGAMSNVLLGCFMDVDRLRKEANRANAEKIKKQMTEEYQKFQKNYSAARSASPSQLSSMMSMAKALSNGSKVAEIAQASPVGSYLLKPAVQDKSKVVFRDRLNGKELFPQNPGTEYAWLDVTLEEDPGQ